MILMNKDDIEFSGTLEEIIEFLGFEIIDDEEFFQVLKEFDTLPNIGNLYMELLCDEIKRILEEEERYSGFNVCVTYYINYLDTHLYLQPENGEIIEIFSLEDFESFHKDYLE